jgi:hypothetical protein
VSVEPVPPSTPIDARPAALVNGRVLQWGEMKGPLTEASGATVLQELVIDRMLAEALADAAITITPVDMDRERALFYGTLDRDPDVAARLASEVRDRRGLGEERFARLLRRNAGLRALVRDAVQVGEESVRRMHDIVHGPRRQIRLLVVSSLADAQEAMRRIEAGEAFADVAVEMSTDVSASRGGLLEPISRSDPSYPEALREAMWELEPGQPSPPVFLGDGYALLMLRREIEGDGTKLDDVRAEMERLVRLDQERILMERLAKRLLARATVTIIDPSLRESWDARRRLEQP